MENNAIQGLQKSENRGPARQTIPFENVPPAAPALAAPLRGIRPTWFPTTTSSRLSSPAATSGGPRGDTQCAPPAGRRATSGRVVVVVVCAHLRPRRNVATTRPRTLLTATHTPVCHPSHSTDVVATARPGYVYVRVRARAPELPHRRPGVRQRRRQKGASNRFVHTVRAPSLPSYTHTPPHLDNCYTHRGMYKSILYTQTSLTSSTIDERHYPRGRKEHNVERRRQFIEPRRPRDGA
jgi:hypothetical protein